MKRFAALFAELDATTVDQRQGRRAAALLRAAPRRATPPGRCTSSPAASRARWCRPALLRALACEARRHRPTGCSTSATRRSATWPRPSRYVLPPPATTSATSAWPSGSRSGCCRCAACRPTSRRARVARYWDELDAPGRFLLTKLIGGGFRVGVSKLLVQRALAAARRRRRQARRAAHDGLHRRRASRPTRRALPRADRAGAPTATRARRSGQPYPFFLAHPLDAAARAVRRARSGRAERLAGRVEVRRHPRARSSSAAAQVWLWSRGEELVTERFPEIVGAGAGAARRHRARRRDRGLAATSAAGALRPAAAAHRPQDADEEGAGRRAGDASWPTTCWSWTATTCATGRSASAARGSRRCCAGSRRSGCRRVETAAQLAGASPRCASESRARGVEGFMLKHRDAALRHRPHQGRRHCGGSGRSIR